MVGLRRVVADSSVLAVVAVERILLIVHISQMGRVIVPNSFEITRVRVERVAICLCLSFFAVQEASGAVVGQIVGIGGAVSGMHTLRVGIVIPAGNTSHGHDGLQALHAGGSQTELGGTGVGAAGHTHLTAGPFGGGNSDVAGLVGVGHTVAGEPLDNVLESGDLQIGAAGLKALGAAGTQTAGLYHGKTADQIGVIGVQILIAVFRGLVQRIVIIPILRVGILCMSHGGSAVLRLTGISRPVQIHLLALLAIRNDRAGGAGNIGAGLHQNAGLILALDSRAGHLHQGLDQVQLAVAVGIKVRLHIHGETDNVAIFVAVIRQLTGGIGEDGLGHAVEEQGLTVIDRCLQCGELTARCQLLQLFQGAGIGAVVTLAQQAHALSHGQVIVGIVAQLLSLQACDLHQAGKSLQHGELLVRIFLCKQIGKALLLSQSDQVTHKGCAGAAAFSNHRFGSLGFLGSGFLRWGFLLFGAVKRTRNDLLTGRFAFAGGCSLCHCGGCAGKDHGQGQQQCCQLHLDLHIFTPLLFLNLFVSET